jgi:hypothetical protein
MPAHNTQQRRDAFFGKTNSGEKNTNHGVLFFAEHLPGRKIIV